MNSPLLPLSINRPKISWYPAQTCLAALLLFGITAVSSCDVLGIGGNDDPDPALPDTTSSHFTWKVDTVGFINTVFRDVAIVDTNNIWVVGEIPEQDFGGVNNYNAMHWDGKQWTKQRIPTKIFNGSILPDVPLRKVVAFPNNELWVFNEAGGYARLINDIWHSAYLAERNGAIEDVAIVENRGAFLVGTQGSFTQWNNPGFIQINAQLSNDLLFAHHANNTLKFGGVDTLLQYTNGVLRPEFSPDALRSFRLSGGFTDVWHSGTHWWYSTGSGLYRFESDSGYVQLSQRGISFLTGNSSQDVFATDRVRSGYHWNGNTITTFDLDAMVPDGIALINGVDMKENLLVITGWTEGLRGFILTGKRNPN